MTGMDNAPRPAPQPRYEGPTYYGRSTVKPSPFNWMVAAYVFIGGVGGAAQIIAALADLGGRGETRKLAGPGRWLSFAASVIGPPFIIADLHTPNRWFNMLRIFRRTSPMSIGSWILLAWGAFSGATALADGAGRLGLRRIGALARVLQVPAALAGAGMTFYTGALLSATSTPLWAAAPRLLAARFASASMAAAASCLALLEGRRGHREAARRLEDLAALAAAAELVCSRASDRMYREKGVDSALHKPQYLATYKGASELLGNMAPLGLYALNRLAGRRSGRLPLLASLSLIAGSAVLRQAIMYAGNESARRPRDYLAFTQPDRPVSNQ